MTDRKPLCTCGQSLWITVENPVDKPVFAKSDAMSLNLKTNDVLASLGSSTSREELLGALIDAFDLLTARVDALQTLVDELRERP